jgi:hypothetical protein
LIVRVGSSSCGAAGVVAEVLNVAVTVTALVSENEHDPVPLHVPPLHPANVDPPDADWVQVTEVPDE